MRADLNVPMDSAGVISDDTRIKSTLSTINKLVSAGCKVIVASHLGRPSKRDPSLSLKPVATRLSELLSKPVLMANDCIGDSVSQQVNSLQDGEVILLENLRFYKQEEANDQEFASQVS